MLHLITLCHGEEGGRKEEEGERKERRKKEGRKEEGRKEEGRKKKDLGTVLGLKTASYDLRAPLLDKSGE